QPPEGAGSQPQQPASQPSPSGSGASGAIAGIGAVAGLFTSLVSTVGAVATAPAPTAGSTTIPRRRPEPTLPPPSATPTQPDPAPTPTGQPSQPSSPSGPPLSGADDNDKDEDKKEERKDNTSVAPLSPETNRNRQLKRRRVAQCVVEKQTLIQPNIPAFLVGLATGLSTVVLLKDIKVIINK